MGFRNSNSLPSNSVKARPFAALWACQTKIKGSLLPFLKPMVLEHSIADKFAAAPQAGGDYFVMQRKNCFYDTVFPFLKSLTMLSLLGKFAKYGCMAKWLS